MSKSTEHTYSPIDPNRMLKLVLDSIPTATFWKNIDSVYLGCNNEFAHDAGVKSPSDIIGKTDYQLAWKKEEADFFVNTDKNVMNNGKPALGIIEQQLQADGKQSWLETNKVPLKDDDGKVIGILGTYNDITERVDALETLKKYAADLEFKNNELEQFAFIAAHDLQEPLKTMASFVQYFEEQYLIQIDQEATVIFEHIKKSSDRMQELITGLLEYARLGREISMTPLNSNELVNEVLVDLNETINNLKARITVESLPSIQASKQELKSVFQNLISNALKFQLAGNIPEIHISCKESEDQWQFSVQDNGIGIDDTYKEKVFIIFQRLNKRSDFEGDGLGLTHCKKIIDIFRGKIWFEAAPVTGTVFHFTIQKFKEHD